MVEFATKRQLRKPSFRLLREQRTLLKERAKQEIIADATFLSHSSKDEELLVGAITLLKNHGGNVYIDEADPEMPTHTSEETANTLKNRIQQAKKFVLLATENSKNSNWVPWELGFADGAKGIEKIALFPAVENQRRTLWTSSEYMGLYNKIVFGSLRGHDEPLWLVWDEATDTAYTLEYWLKN